MTNTKVSDRPAMREPGRLQPLGHLPSSHEPPLAGRARLVTAIPAHIRQGAGRRTQQNGCEAKDPPKPARIGYAFLFVRNSVPFRGMGMWPSSRL